MKITFKDLEDMDFKSVTDYCRFLISEGREDLEQTIEVYRGKMLCLTVSSVKYGASVEPRVEGGFKRFVRRPGASLVRLNRKVVLG